MILLYSSSPNTHFEILLINNDSNILLSKKKTNILTSSGTGGMDDTWVTLWLVTLVNHNVTSVQQIKKPCERKKKKVICDKVVGQYHQSY